MHHKRTLGLLFFGSLMLLMGASLWLMTPEIVKAQCGSQASSCKNCHEVQGQDPVNNDGTKWHQSHAFGDFCVFCHAGNQQATDKTEAHTGMVPPLSDVKAACQSCHAADLDSRVQVYAAILKVTPGNGGTTNHTTPVATQQAGVVPAVQPTAQSTQVTPISTPVSAAMVIDDPNVVDYAQRYNEIVLGQRPVNWGNITLAVLIGLIVVGGGVFAVFNELRLHHVFAGAKKVEGEYPADVVEMLPSLSSLSPRSRRSLGKILKQPAKTDKVLGAIDNLVSDEGTEE